MALRFFKMPRHQQFDYKTRYYNPAKEDLEERLQRVDKNKEGGVDAVKSRLSSTGFRRHFEANTNSYRKSQVKRSNFILMGVIIVLLLLAYLFLTVYLPRFIQLLETQGK